MINKHERLKIYVATLFQIFNYLFILPDRCCLNFFRSKIDVIIFHHNYGVLDHFEDCHGRVNGSI